MIKIKTMGTEEAPAARMPMPGAWYHGVNQDGSIGLLVRCVWVGSQGSQWSASYADSDDRFIDMSRYPYIEEHLQKIN